MLYNVKKFKKIAPKLDFLCFKSVRFSTVLAGISVTMPALVAANGLQRSPLFVLKEVYVLIVIFGCS